MINMEMRYDKEANEERSELITSHSILVMINMEMRYDKEARALYIRLADEDS